MFYAERRSKYTGIKLQPIFGVQTAFGQTVAKDCPYALHNYSLFYKKSVVTCSPTQTEKSVASGLTDYRNYEGSNVELRSMSTWTCENYHTGVTSIKLNFAELFSVIASVCRPTSVYRYTLRCTNTVNISHRLFFCSLTSYHIT